VLLKASESTFSRPHDLVVTPDGLYLIVADIGNDVVKVLNPGTLATIGVIGKGELNSPHDVDIDIKGRLLVADSGNDRIVVYQFGGVTRGGVIARQVASWDRGQSGPEGVSYGPGGRVYVASTGSDSVVVLEDGKVAARAGTSGSGPDQYSRPHDIEVDERGRVFVADPGNNRIQVLDTDLAVVRTLGGAEYAFNEPKYVAVDEKGWLFVADEDNNQIRIFDDAYAQVGAIGTGERGSGPGQLNKPEGVDVAGRYIWVSDTYNDRILLFRRGGS
jgi:DNA-binding beta-propeller fold protein YncE